MIGLDPGLAQRLGDVFHPLLGVAEQHHRLLWQQPKAIPALSYGRYFMLEFQIASLDEILGERSASIVRETLLNPR